MLTTAVPPCRANARGQRIRARPCSPPDTPSHRRTAGRRILDRDESRRIVHQHVDPPTKGIRNSRDQVGDRRRIGQVSDEQPVCSPDILQTACQPVLGLQRHVPRAAPDHIPSLRQPQGDVRADPSPTAGDERDRPGHRRWRTSVMPIDSAASAIASLTILHLHPPHPRVLPEQRVADVFGDAFDQGEMDAGRQGMCPRHPSGRDSSSMRPAACRARIDPASPDRRRSTRATAAAGAFPRNRSRSEPEPPGRAPAG